MLESRYNLSIYTPTLGLISERKVFLKRAQLDIGLSDISVWVQVFFNTCWCQSVQLLSLQKVLFKVHLLNYCTLAQQEGTCILKAFSAVSTPPLYYIFPYSSKETVLLQWPDGVCVQCIIIKYSLVINLREQPSEDPAESCWCKGPKQALFL